MSNPEFYMAAVWPSQNSAASQGEPPRTILIFGAETPLDKGLRRMEADGWKLMKVQINRAYTSWQFHLAERLYLFRKAA